MAESEWTLSTIKELFEERLASLSAKHDADFRLVEAKLIASADALVKQAIEYERRLDALNNENARIVAAAALSVSREVYDADKTAIQEGGRRIELLASNAVPREEFSLYKDSTSTALNVQQGKREGIGVSATTIIQALTGIALVVSLLIGVSTIFSGPRALPVANPVVYQPAVQGQGVIAPAIPQK